jgi:hypothetical protein
MCFVEKTVRLQTTLRAILKSHCEFLLPPKEGEGQDEGASVSPGFQINYSRWFYIARRSLKPVQ